MLLSSSIHKSLKSNFSKTIHFYHMPENEAINCKFFAFWFNP